jgi:hypothetical protein
MTTHPILGELASVESLGRAVLEAIRSSGRCSIPTMLAEINARGREFDADYRAVGSLCAQDPACSEGPIPCPHHVEARSLREARSELLEAYDLVGDVTTSAILAGERRALNPEHAEIIHKKAQKAFLWISNVYTTLYGTHPGDDLRARSTATGEAA